MPSSPAPAKNVLKPGNRVTLTRDIRGVPEQTNGVVKVANGLTWARYWVQFDNGHWVGSVSGADLVREGDYDEFVARRSEEFVPRGAGEGLGPKVGENPAVAAADGGGDAAAGGGASSRVPAHLLER